MRWSVVRLIAAREVRDQLRDRRTLFLILGLPVLMYPLFVGVGILFVTALKEKRLTIGVVGAEHQPKAPTDITPLAGGAAGHDPKQESTVTSRMPDGNGPSSEATATGKKARWWRSCCAWTMPRALR